MFPVTIPTKADVTSDEVTDALRNGLEPRNSREPRYDVLPSVKIKGFSGGWNQPGLTSSWLAPDRAG